MIIFYCWQIKLKKVIDKTKKCTYIQIYHSNLKETRIYIFENDLESDWWSSGIFS